MSTDDGGVRSPPSVITENPWSELRRFTRARVALGRAGTSLPTKALLDFQLDHARAVDAVHQPLDMERLSRALRASDIVQSLIGEPTIVVESEAADQDTFLQRPDLGRRLREQDARTLREFSASKEAGFDLVVLLSGGLSASAVQRHAPPFLEELTAQLKAQHRTLTVAPLVMAPRARVALGDDVGESIGARMALVLVGERPGLTSPDSMGAYLTWSARRGTLDSQRNCVSNIRPEGLSYGDAAGKVTYLIREARRLQCTGIGLKDRADDTLLDAKPSAVSHRAFQLSQDAEQSKPER